MRSPRAPHRGVGDERAEESPPELWERLAGEMRSAREDAGIRPSDWGDTPDVPWTRSHLSNLEHGRGRPTPEIAALYDERCPHPSGPLFFADLQTAATRAEERAKGPRRRQRQTASGGAGRRAPRRARRGPGRRATRAPPGRVAGRCHARCVASSSGEHEPRARGRDEQREGVGPGTRGETDSGR